MQDKISIPALFIKTKDQTGLQINKNFSKNEYQIFFNKKIQILNENHALEAMGLTKI